MGCHRGEHGSQRGENCQRGNCTAMERIQVARPAPIFTGSAVMPDGSIKELNLADYIGEYVLLYFYPLDFTYVCPSEIIAFDKMVESFKQKKVNLIGCSVDSVYCHSAWRNTELKDGGIGKINHPLLSDITKSISRSYGVLIENEGVALRGLFLIDKAGVLQHSLINNKPVGRSVDEAVRVIDALQFSEAHGDVCPANWKAGQKAMKPTKDGVAEYLSKQ